jgi:hypothetical protein
MSSAVFMNGIFYHKGKPRFQRKSSCFGILEQCLDIIGSVFGSTFVCGYAYYMRLMSLMIIVILVF